MLRLDEGLRLKPYIDSLGHMTIGYGRALNRRGITKQEAEWMLEDDACDALSQCSRRIPSFRALDIVRQTVLVNMAYNLGINGLLNFKRMLAAIDRKDWDEAALEMVHSNWHHQVGPRALRLEAMMRTGEMHKDYL
jgi:lysozyme